MENFSSLNLHETLVGALNVLRFTTPTSIQAQTIPHALNGSDVLGSSQTGTGKTFAYGIPLISYLLNSKGMALVLTPTRELAVQVFNAIYQLTHGNRALNGALLIGGEPMVRQLKDLRHKPRFIVGTPGRVYDHLLRGSLKLNTAQFLVLDEIDRMLDMGFVIQLDQINTYLPEQKQTLMFSATVTASIEKIAQNYLKTPVRISVGAANTPIEKIQQEIVQIGENLKYTTLVERLNKLEGSCIVFTKTKHHADQLSFALREDGMNVDALHGDLKQRSRDRVVRAFRGGNVRILVATDIAARGLDIQHVACVINYDLPQCAEDYVHRIGRTGRAGAAGIAISFVAPADRQKWQNICKLIDPAFRDHSQHNNAHSRSSYGARNSQRDRSSAKFGHSAKFGGGDRSDPGARRDTVGRSRFGGDTRNTTSRYGNSPDTRYSPNNRFTDNARGGGRFDARSGISSGWNNKFAKTGQRFSKNDVAA